MQLKKTGSGDKRGNNKREIERNKETRKLKLGRLKTTPKQ